MNLNRLAYFAAVVDTGSFTRAAERLGITKAVVSQQVALLEQDRGPAYWCAAHPADRCRPPVSRALRDDPALSGACLR